MTNPAGEETSRSWFTLAQDCKQRIVHGNMLMMRKPFFIVKLRSSPPSYTSAIDRCRGARDFPRIRHKSFLSRGIYHLRTHIYIAYEAQSVDQARSSSRDLHCTVQKSEYVKKWIFKNSLQYSTFVLYVVFIQSNSDFVTI